MVALHSNYDDGDCSYDGPSIPIMRRYCSYGGPSIPIMTTVLQLRWAFYSNHDDGIAVMLWAASHSNYEDGIAVMGSLAFQVCRRYCSCSGPCVPSDGL
ncbi:hypothetical protein CEXT_236901 [Caerostris extrusa]|uniref:Uncharacterized protein n=1 Tax=Caerostris extrusa TaxID=172846 RepID=A0AAV4XUS1_CAEEX|nr:hypothetical protein CEXT_236901 [Caerostris extrusa]